MKNEPTVLKLEAVKVTPPPDSCDVIRDYIVVTAYDRMREEDGGENASIMRRLRQFAGEKARGACPDMFLEEELTPTWTVNYEPFGVSMTLKVRYEIRPAVHQKFISPEAKADATIEDAPVNQFQFVSQIKFLPSEITANPSDLSAMQPVLDSVPHPTTASTGNAASGPMSKGGRELMAWIRDTSPEWTAAAREEIHVKWQKRDDLDAAMTKECRAALAKLREWPRCKDHDQPMSVRCCLPFVGNGKRYVFAGCSEIGCRRASSPVEIELTGPTARAIGDESWIAPEYRA